MLLIGLTGSIATGKSSVSAILSSPPYSLPIIDADLIARQVVEPGTPGYNAIVKYFEPSTPDLLLPPDDDAATKRADGKGEGAERPINRAVLGKRVFGMEEERVRDRGVLNGIVHPAVRTQIYKSLLYYFIKGYWAVVLDVPLLYESKWDVLCGTVIVVAVSEMEVQIRRLRERDGHLSEVDAVDRVRSQGGVMGKVRRCLLRNQSFTSHPSSQPFSQSTTSPTTQNPTIPQIQTSNPQTITPALAKTQEGPAGVIIWNDGTREELKKEVARVMGIIEGASPAWWRWVSWGVPVVAVGRAGWVYWGNLRGVRGWEEREKMGGERARL